MKKITPICIIFCFVFFSCKKYLDEKPNNTQVVPSTISDLQGLLDDAGNMNLTPVMGEASSDDYFLQQAIYNGRPTFEQEMYLWHPTPYYFQNDWSTGYAPIYNANYSLEMIEKIGITDQNKNSWNNVKGSALFYRAYNYLMLTWNYAKSFANSTSNNDPGIALRNGSDFNVPSTRASVFECYDRVINETKESLKYLPDLPTHVYRPSKNAAYALLARTYLSMRMYDSAYRYSDLSLTLKSDLIDYKNSSDPDIVSPINSGTSAVFKRFNRETIFYTEINSTISIVAPSRARTDTSLFSSYTISDLRRTGFFRPDGSYQRFRGSYAQNTSVLFSGIATDEMYLIKSECLARGVNGSSGNKDAAMLVLNSLLVKRHNNTFGGLSATDATDALNKILLERRKELTMRGLRWIDIKRLNNEGRNIVLKRIINGQSYMLQPNANYYALPLPTDIISTSNMPQNAYP